MEISITMRVFVVLFAVVAAASAASVAIDYLPPVADNSLLTQEYITPESSEEPALLADDGYRYKTVRKLKFRHRRDVSELPSSEYLPASVDARAEVAIEPVPEVISVAAPEEEKTELAEDGYRYKTVRRLKYRHRRDVNELPANKYLPPTEVTEEVVAVAEPATEDVSVVVPAPEEKTELAEDGYRYKTVRRLKYRHRRDVNELPANKYLPPTEVASEVAVEPVPEVISVEEVVPEEKTELAEDGYRYKTVRRLKYRHRRDVNELPANEYLPPTEVAQEVVSVVEPVAEEVAAPEENTELAEDGYRYKTVRRLKYRHRRDVNELPANEYLPPTEVAPEVVSVVEPVVEEVAVPEEKTELAEDGYRYKTVRRLKYRHRRDVNELPANEYLPPTEVAEEAVAVAQPEEVAVVEAVPEEKTELAEDGYRYKTVRRLKYRHRRDVNELPANEYLPPTEVAQEVVSVVEPVVEEVAVPEEKTELAEDGYRYKTVRRLKYRHRRDVNELPVNEYLPPTEVAQEAVAVAQPEEVAVVETAPEEKTELAEDGYRYKTVRRLKYRHRRDVNELPANEYLPPTEVAQEAVAVAQPEEVAVVETAPEEKTELAEDGYRYKTVRRLKYRHRRDVNELPANEYLPPTEVAQEVVSVVEPVVEEVAVPEEKTELAEDGYRYKTVRRLKYRHRRDVNELPANEYLPPTEVAQEAVAVAQPEEVAVVETAPEEKTELAEDGYRYKTVRRLKYRHRRDVSELPANEYLPPTEVAQEVVSVVEPVVEEVAAPEENTELAEDGYRYKTVRRLKYRHRRDVNELPANEYLPPTEVAEEAVDVAQPEEIAVVEAVPEEKTELAEDGYRYKTVRRLKYRHRRDVNELPGNEYLPPTEVAEEVVSVVEPVVEEVAAPEEKTELAEDGYRYKTVRRLKYRHRRDVNELPANEYLPPTEVAQEAVAVAQTEEVAAVETAPEEKTELAEDGYRYKTVRRLKYRHRRDIN
ncbi:titin-like [Calliphora vicina]|uniref:titin-like n=1 Tax=Calliphora vicina TaxID=7373 RepID=UPI00325BD6CA